MSQHDAFDPYLEWLCIPITRRPPTYYDLLGLRPFESEIETIRQQAQARYRLVHQYQAGRRGDLAVPLLAELAQARDVLCDPQRKAQYDAWLLAQGGSHNVTPVWAPPDAASAQVPPPFAPGSGAHTRSTAPGGEPTVLAQPAVVPYGQQPLPGQQPSADGYLPSPPAPQAGVQVHQGGITAYGNDEQQPAAGYAQASPQEVPALRGVRNLVLAALTVAIALLLAAWLLTRGGTTPAANGTQDQIAQQPGTQPGSSQPSASGGSAGATPGLARRSQARRTQGRRSQARAGQPAAAQPDTPLASPPPGSAAAARSQCADNTGGPPRANGAGSPPMPPAPENLPDVSEPNPWQQSVSMAWETPARVEPLQVLSDNSAWPSTVAFSPDGTLLACGTRTGTVLLWTVADGRLLFTLDAHVDAVAAMAFSPDGKLLATAGLAPLPADQRKLPANNQGLRFWRLKDGVLDRQMLALPSRPIAMVFSANTRDLAAACEDGTVAVWRVAKRQLLRRRNAKVGNFDCAAFSPDAQLLAACTGTTVRVWRAADGEVVSIHPLQFSAERLAFNERGTQLAIVCGDGCIKACSCGAGGSERTYCVQQVAGRNARPSGARAGQETEEQGLRFAQFTPDGKLLVGADRTHLFCWDGASGRLLAMVPCVDVEALAISPDGTLVACAHENGEVSIWQVVSGGGLVLSSRHAEAVTALACSSDGALVASASNEGIVCVWQAADGKLTATVPAIDEGGVPLALAFRSGGAKLAVIRSQELTWCNLKDGRLTGEPRDSEQRRVACSPDGGTLALADENALSLWEGERLVPRTIYNFGEKAISRIAVGPGGEAVALGLINDSEYCLNLWRERGDEEQTLDRFTSEVSALAFSGDGRCLACAAGGGKIHVYDVSGGQAACTVDCRQNVRSLAFSPDGRTLACAAGHRILLYGLPKADSLGSIDAHSTPVTTLIFAPDGSWLASGGEDGQVRVWRPAAAGVPAAR